MVIYDTECISIIPIATAIWEGTVGLVIIQFKRHHIL